MGMKKDSYFLMMVLILGSVAPFVDAGAFSNPINDWQASNPTLDGYYKGSVDTYWPILNNLENDDCSSANSDFIVAIPVGGCSPTVVRSDLLAEQNVPVFCQLTAIKVNPLIDVSTIKSISFKGEYPDEVAGISFHPARAAVNSGKSLMGSPIEQNIGYVVIVLKKQPIEANLEEFVSGMLTASIKYDVQTTFGTGAGDYYLEPMSKIEWERNAAYTSFWGGKGYLRTTKIEENTAVIEVLTSKDDVLESVILAEGELSEPIYYPGQYCTSSVQLKLNKIDNSEDMVKLDVDGDSIWARKGTKLFNKKCIVGNIRVGETGSGEVDISCTGVGSFTLKLGNYGKSFVYGGKTYIAIGQNKIARSDEWMYEKIEDDWKWSSPEGKSGIVDFVNESVFYEKANDAILGFGGDTILGGKYATSTFIPKYVDLAEDVTIELLEEFPFEIKGNKEYWGEEALYGQILIAASIEDKESQIELINLYLDTYPESTNTEFLRDKKILLLSKNIKGSSKSISINNQNYNLRVEGFIEGNGDSDNVNVRFNGGSLISMKKGKIYDKNGKEINATDVPRISVTSISSSGARFNYYWRDENDKAISRNFAIGNEEYYSIGGLEIYMVETNIREVAYVSLIPTVKDQKIESNFTFKIGIEKRAVELTPEKTTEKIRELNESIIKWEERVESLGTLLDGMKAACFGVSTVLNLKAMFSGSGGESVARGDVMDIFEEKCKNEGASTSAELQKCYSEYNDDIESDIQEYANAVEAVNSQVKCAKTSETTETGFLESKVINSKAYVKELAECAGLRDDWVYNIGGVEVTKGHLIDVRDYQAVLLRENACANGMSGPCNISTKKMERALSDNVNRIMTFKETQKNEDNTGVAIPSAINFNKNAITIEAVSAKGNNLGAGQNNYLAQVQSVTNTNVYYYIELDKTQKIVNIYDINMNLVKDEVGEKDKATFSVEDEKTAIAGKYQFQLPNGGNSCFTRIKDPYIRYYEEANQQGFSAIVPFDLNEGWYAYIDDNDYSKSGEPNAFWICNVGKDGAISEGPNGGDICTRFSTSIGPNVKFTPCPKLSDSQVSSLYSKAQAAIRGANNDGNGLDVDGVRVRKASPMGTDNSGLECTDFMSVDDCNLMFNVCDPVICPSSRCDMGGKFPVADVVSTGIVGSVALCLPNFGSPSEGGVALPVCLTGIHAGLDSYVSILKSYKSCLEQNVESGEYIGICDEISAIYTCEFFWGQVSPLLDNLLPAVVNGFGGVSQTRGGAEYLTTQAAFDNVEKSVDYFTKNYAKNSFDSFNLQSTEEIGTTICNGFVGSSMPSLASMFEKLIEPESPSQFYAYFSESAFTEATVPSTSQYKVFFHIYAGNDEGVQYKVYLKNPPQSSYYANRQTILVDSGFAAAGSSADQSKDFTAPSGYKELCVSLNGRDECGFGKVTSDFGLNYATQSYVADQAQNMNIQTTEDCVTTSASTWGLINPNLQSGAETAIGGDDIATAGISRICASANPEQGVIGGNDIYCDATEVGSVCADGYSCVAISGNIETGVGVCESGSGDRQTGNGKWIDVGYCDSENVRCWLDSTTVSENLNIYSAVNGVDFVDDLIRNTGRLEELDETYRNVREKLNSLRADIENLDEELGVDLEGEVSESVALIVIGLDQVSGANENLGQGLNSDKAEALALKSELYRMVAKELMIGAPELKIVGSRMTKEEVEKILEKKSVKSKTSTNNDGNSGSGDTLGLLANWDSTKILPELVTVEDLSKQRELAWLPSSYDMRTDRHNNPTAFITALAEQAVEEKAIYNRDYSIGDLFEGSSGTYYTARLNGDAIDVTIKVIDELGFYTNDGSRQRWVHTAMSDEDWLNLSVCEKANVIKVMYNREGGTGILFKGIDEKYICDGEVIVDKSSGVSPYNFDLTFNEVKEGDTIIYEGEKYGVIEKIEGSDIVILMLENIETGVSKRIKGGVDEIISKKDFESVTDDYGLTVFDTENDNQESEDVELEPIDGVWIKFNEYIKGENNNDVNITLDRDEMRIKFESTEGRGWSSFDDAEFYISSGKFVMDILGFGGKKNYPVEDIEKLDKYYIINKEVVEVAKNLNQIFLNYWEEQNGVNTNLETKVDNIEEKLDKSVTRDYWQDIKVGNVLSNKEGIWFRVNDIAKVEPNYYISLQAVNVPFNGHQFGVSGNSLLKDKDYMFVKEFTEEVNSHIYQNIEPEDIIQVSNRYFNENVKYVYSFESGHLWWKEEVLFHWSKSGNSWRINIGDSGFSTFSDIDNLGLNVRTIEKWKELEREGNPKYMEYRLDRLDYSVLDSNSDELYFHFSNSDWSVSKDYENWVAVRSIYNGNLGKFVLLSNSDLEFIKSLYSNNFNEGINKLLSRDVSGRLDSLF